MRRAGGRAVAVMTKTAVAVVKEGSNNPRAEAGIRCTIPDQGSVSDSLQSSLEGRPSLTHAKTPTRFRFADVKYESKKSLGYQLELFLTLYFHLVLEYQSSSACTCA